jgi:hypothetical protein
MVKPVEDSDVDDEWQLQHGPSMPSVCLVAFAKTSGDNMESSSRVAFFFAMMLKSFVGPRKSNVLRVYL